MLARFFAFILTAFTLLLIPIPAIAQTPSVVSKQISTSTATPLQPIIYPLPSTVSPTSPLYTDLMISNLFHSFSCLAIGQSIIGQPCLTYQITKNAQGMVQRIPMLSSVDLSGGALGTTTSLITELYDHPPVKTVDYLASVGQGLGIVKEAHAQVVGSGANVLNPVLALWQVSRNIAYIVMIVIFVIIGLLIMFRNKINPQTVITAQAALPGLIIGLIMITFSFFFAGLISDVAFVGTNIVGYYFSAVKGQADKPQNLVQDISFESSLSIFSHFVGIIGQGEAHDTVGAVFDKLDAGAKSTVRFLVGFLAAQFVAPLAGGIPPPIGLITGIAIPIISGTVVGTDPSYFLGWFLSLISVVVLMYAMIKLLLRLVSAYLTIIFLTVSAPFHFLVASLPGRQSIATGWVLDMVANLLAFPAVLVIFYFVAFLIAPIRPDIDFRPLKVTNTNQIQNSGVVPVAQAAGEIRIIDSSGFPLFGGMGLGFIRVILAFGALMALPSIPDVVARTIGRVSQAGQMIGQEIGSGVRGGQGYANQLQGASSGTIGGVKKSILGDTQWSWNESQKKWVPSLGRPGIKQWFWDRPAATTPGGKVGVR